MIKSYKVTAHLEVELTIACDDDDFSDLVQQTIDKGDFKIKRTYEVDWDYLERGQGWN